MSKKATLTVKDQVNIKFDGLDPMVRKELVKKLSFMNPKARHMPAFKMGRWDGKVPFATIGGGTFYNFLYEAATIVMNAGYEIDLVDQRPDWDIDLPPIDKNYLSAWTWPKGHRLEGEPIVLNDHQVESVNRYFEPNEFGNRHSMQAISTSAGKAQPLTAKVLTPEGWTTMGNLRVGDCVSAPDGTVTTVTGIFPQGRKKIYRITFVDGRFTECCDEHLWKVHKATWHRAACHNYSDWDVISTSQLRKLISKKTNRNRLSVPLVRPNYDEIPVDLPIDPYLLGALLGDGSFRNNRVTLSSADDEIIERVSASLMPGYRLKHVSRYDYLIGIENYREERAKNGRNTRAWQRYVVALRDLGLMETYSDTKFIPSMYKEASALQRLELLRGLMDTDGTVGRNGETSYSTCSKQLSDDVMDLVRSLGGTATVTTKRPALEYKGDKKQGKTSYTVRIRFQRPADLFHLTRKKQKTSKLHRFDLRLGIKSIEEIGSMEAQCIMVDHPEHLYVTDNYIVTHNTIITACMSMACEPYGRTLVIVPGKDLVGQTLEDYVNVGLDTGVYFQDIKMTDNKHIISTWQSLTRMYKDDNENFWKIIHGVVAIIVDEAHTITGKELRDMLCGPMAHIPLRWALTGTIPKEPHEYNALICAIGPKVGEVRAQELQELGILSDCHIDIMQLVDDVDYRSWDQEIEYLTTDKKRVAFIADTIREINKSGNTLVLVSRVPMGKELAEQLDTPFIYGNVASKKRKEEYKSVNTENNKIIVATFGVASTGINIPRIFNLVLIEPGKSFVRVIQSIGRGLRRAADKDFVQIYDICSTAKFSKRHLTERKADYKDAGYPHAVRKVTYR